MQNMTNWLIVLMVANIAVLGVTLVFYRRVKKAQAKRRVEAPNSQYKSQYVLDLESRERWEALQLDRLHEVNREEVEKLLVRLRANGVRGLTTSERAFLDRMVEAETRVKARARKRSDGGPRMSSGTPKQLPTG
jgi:hypothetical protein